MSARTKGIYVKVDAQVKKRLDDVLACSGRTLTGLLRHFFERFLSAADAASGAGGELIVFLSPAKYEAAARRAGGENYLGTTAQNVIGAWADGGDITNLSAVKNYEHFPRFVEIAKAAIEQMLAAYVELPPYRGDLAELLAGAMMAAPIREMLDQRIRGSVSGSRTGSKSRSGVTEKSKTTKSDPGKETL